MSTPRRLLGVAGRRTALSGTGLALALMMALPARAVPALSVADVSVTKGQGRTASMVSTVSLFASSSSTITVQYATADGTAEAAADYAAASGTLSFDPGTTTGTITVAVQGDSTCELAETFFVVLSGASGASIERPRAVGTILPGDLPAAPMNGRRRGRW